MRECYTTKRMIYEELLRDTDGTFTRAYLLGQALNDIGEQLLLIRRLAKLTQRQLADLLKTHQSRISILEAENNEGITLQQYTRYAIACGMVPMITMMPLEEVKQQLIEALAPVVIPVAKVPNDG